MKDMIKLGAKMLAWFALCSAVMFPLSYLVTVVLYGYFFEKEEKEDQ